MEQEKLRECPFCGGEAMLQRSRNDWQVICTEMECDVAPETDLMPEREWAIAAWNRRPDTRKEQG